MATHLPEAGLARGFEGFLHALTADPGYAGQITHVEHLPPRPAHHAALDPPLSPQLTRALGTFGIDALYTHQALTVAAARAGENAVTVAGTAGGKTLGFLLPVLETLERDPRTTAILLYPTKALAQDQLKGITRLLERHPELSRRVRAGVYDGDTSQSARRKIRDEAQLILTNPDMLHRGILPYHGKWARMFKNLRFVIVDEVHTYRGIFGSNVGNVLRRLRRVAAHHRLDGSGEPVFLCSSATIRNPRELCETLTGARFRLIDDDGSPRGPRTFVLWNPPYRDGARMERASSNVEARDILVRLMDHGTATIVFTKARVVAELIYRYAREIIRGRGGVHNQVLADRLTPYRGGYLPGERREIERRLFSGELLGVVSTNALELGIDIGGLDASVIVGFPGTVAGVWQQAGRAGRSQDPALTVLVAYNDPIDQYLAHHPRYFFAQNPEAAVCDPMNPYILTGHLGCAAFELPLTAADRELFGEESETVRDLLRERGSLTAVADDDYWARPEVPAARVSLRTMSDSTYTIVDADRNHEVIGTVDAISALELVYPEAIYLHQGETYFVSQLDLEKQVAHVRRIEADYYTQPVIDAAIREGLERDRGEALPETTSLHEVTVSWTTCMFKKIRFGSTDSIGYRSLSLPWQTLDTVALAWTPSDTAVRELFRAGRKPTEGLYGVRNLAITVFPVLAMCDRADVGGIVDSSNRGRPTLYLYDRFPGGLGFAERAHEEFPALLREALRLLTACGCEKGCPSCVGLPVLRPAQHQDPDGGGGYPIPDKEAAELLLRAAAREVDDDRRMG